NEKQYWGEYGPNAEHRIEVFFGSPNGGDFYRDYSYKKSRIEKEYLSKPNSGRRYRADLGLEEYYYPFSIKKDNGDYLRGLDSVYSIDEKRDPPVNFAAWPIIFCPHTNLPDSQCTAAFSISRELQGFYRFQFRHLKDFRSLHLYIIETIGNLQEK
uniref:hypothetical protein n=1 Tax=Chitinibacter sp. ZOR0017 TaxID=1339254 RepID=UPI0006469EE2